MSEIREQLKTTGIEIFTGPKGKVRLNPNGLSASRQTLIRETAIDLFEKARKDFSHALERCTFFADYGYDALLKIADNKDQLKNVRIEGCDDNPFDQHYWVACDLVQENKQEIPVLFDPIFGYVGLEERAGDILGNKYLRYYREKRKVEPDKPVSEGGVRVKTIGI